MNLNTRAIAAAGIVALALPLSSVLADTGDPIGHRQGVMKIMGKNAKTLGEMTKGVTPFDAAIASAAFSDMRDAVQPYGDYFPEGSGVGETRAAPAIWEKRAEFDAILAKFKGALATAAETEFADVAALGATFGAVAENCGACHKGFRLEKK